MSNIPAAQREALARRRAEREPRCFLELNEADLLELSEGRVPELVQRNAAWALEPVDVMLVRKHAERTRRKA